MPATVDELRNEQREAQRALEEISAERGGIEQKVVDARRQDSVEKMRAARAGQSPEAVTESAPELEKRREALPYLAEAARLRLERSNVALLEAQHAEATERARELAAEAERTNAEAEPVIRARDAARAEAASAQARQSSIKDQLSGAQRRLRELERI